MEFFFRGQPDTESGNDRLAAEEVFAAGINDAKNGNARALGLVEGIFVYEPGPGSIVPLGVQTLSLTFYPASADYTTTVASVSMLVGNTPWMLELLWWR